MSQIKVNYPQGDAVLWYDHGQTTAQQVIQAVLGQRPDLSITIEADHPSP